MSNKTYVIEVSDRLNEFTTDITVVGYFCGTYNSRGTFIASTTPYANNADRIMLFTSLDKAAGRVKSLIEVKLHNAYLSHMKFRVIEISEEEANKIKEAKREARINKEQRKVEYVGVSKKYLQQLLEIYISQQNRYLSDDIMFYYAGGKIDAIKEILDNLNGKGE